MYQPMLYFKVYPIHMEKLSLLSHELDLYQAGEETVSVLSSFVQI